MQRIETSIHGVLVLVPKKFGDARGFFSETYSQREWAEMGMDDDFVQDNHSKSVETGVVRGLHYQLPPMAQTKLIRVVSGAVLDVVVDIRRGSRTFGNHIAEELSAENWKQVYVPAGFAHGFVTLRPNTEVIYKVSNYYSPEHERGLRWNDPALCIDWAIDESTATLSDRDRLHPMLNDLRDLF
jgi:dTDP-4-dehydrorhamnose 3,5-epimerase